jgi:hypothetical protein
LQVVFAIHHPDIDLESVLVFQEFLDAFVQPQKWADQKKAIFGGFDNFLEEVIGSAGVEEFRHGIYGKCSRFLL